MERQGRSDDLVKEVEELRAAQCPCCWKLLSCKVRSASLLLVKVSNATRLMSVGDVWGAEAALGEVESWPILGSI